MSNIASLEVYRPVLLARGREEPVNQAQPGDFIEKAATMARLLLDQNGKSLITLRTDNVVRPTIVQATRVYPRLRYVHNRLAASDVKHLAKKMVAARMLMEEGRPDKRVEPLAAALGRVAKNGFGISEDTLFYDLEVGRTDVVTQDTREGTRHFIVLRPEGEDTADNTESEDSVESMLRAMSHATAGFLASHASSRLQDATIPSIADSIPVARVDSPDFSKAEFLASHIAELLPLTVSVSSEVSFESNY